ncbi:sigma-70 family RNA polymerase sigma factor [Stigmatella aurantiaca]|uniref:Myxococcus probable DNA-binding regulatory protein, putative n=1 Tax=Stigmatella aurantiaca (strain DW4/3-1) TaxID=378806 RepID=Q09C90_STIAD|nr:sigma-70 family RNA polymerase sigma factor [Stigmatella aurantiaca]ADO69540.1 RNA polymerase sigma-70 (Myxococcus xanthus family) [Stigmatella aurantiaca DW4/3-1]EAU69389.1 myxococcus probable DNA-binding regulatory protein, putative [Stigmatella aurantiaca DW4/3-1]
MSESRGPRGLSALLKAHAGPQQRAALEQEPGLEALLESHCEAARAQWPTFPWSAERFMRHLAHHLPEGLGEPLRQLRAADLYLACACAEGERLALQAFEEHILQRVPSRLGSLPEATVDEVLQVLRARLLLKRGEARARIADYSGRGPLLAWVRIIATRIAGELASQQGRQDLFDEPPEVFARMLAADDPERELLREDSRRVLMEALRKALAAMPERERALLRLHHLHGLTMDRLSAMYGESRSGVARRVIQARERLLALTHAELALRLNLAGPEVQSLLGLVRSRLDFSLNRLME